MRLNINYLYYDVLNLYGDRGNITILKYRAEKRGIDVKIYYTSIGDKLLPKDVDILFMGGGEDIQQEAIQEDLWKKRDAIREIVESEIVVLTICGSYQLFGEYYITAEGEKIKGLKIFDIYTVPGEKRMIGNILTEVNLYGERVKIVGFENHRGKTYIKNMASAFGRVLSGYGNNGEDKTEGVVYKNCFGTYLHGPLLSKNPELADFFIKKALSAKYRSKIELKKLDDGAELKAKKYVIHNLLKML